MNILVVDDDRTNRKLLRVKLEEEGQQPEQLRQPSTSAQPTPDHRPPKKILIIEDERNIAKTLAVRLNALGYQAVLAYDALSGLKTARHSSPDLVLLNISLPAGSGIAAAEKIQTLLPRKTPVIFLTA